MYGAIDAGRPTDLLQRRAQSAADHVALGRSTAVRRLECGGPIVGLFEAATFEEETVTLTAGDWLIVFSDGVSEAMSASGDEYGESRIVDVRRSATRRWSRGSCSRRCSPTSASSRAARRRATTSPRWC